MIDPPLIPQKSNEIIRNSNDRNINARDTSTAFNQYFCFINDGKKCEVLNTESTYKRNNTG